MLQWLGITQKISTPGMPVRTADPDASQQKPLMRAFFALPMPAQPHTLASRTEPPVVFGGTGRHRRRIAHLADPPAPQHRLTQSTVERTRLRRPGAWSVYLIDRLLDREASHIARHAWLKRWHRPAWLLALALAGGGICAALQLPRPAQLAIGAGMLLTFGYCCPSVRTQRALRQWLGMKLPLIVMVWTLATVVVPLLENAPHLEPARHDPVCLAGPADFRPDIAFRLARPDA